jgi:hypothetical protein
MKVTGKRAVRFLLVTSLSLFAAYAESILTGSATTASPQDVFGVSGLGFSMSGAGGFYSPAAPCGVFSLTVCNAPGSYFFSDVIDSEATPGGMSGVYTVNGVPYSYACNQASTCSAGISFSGVLTLPDFGASPPGVFVVTTSFTSTGGISGVLIGPGQFAPDLMFQGSGIATISLRESFPSQYVFSGATYTFVATPEPETLSLVALGMGSLFFVARSRRIKTQENLIQ